jgi:hypothetical protein
VKAVKFEIGFSSGHNSPSLVIDKFDDVQDGDWMNTLSFR